MGKPQPPPVYVAEDGRQRHQQGDQVENGTDCHLTRLSRQALVEGLESSFFGHFDDAAWSSFFVNRSVLARPRVTLR